MSSQPDGVDQKHRNAADFHYFHLIPIVSILYPQEECEDYWIFFGMRLKDAQTRHMFQELVVGVEGGSSVFWICVELKDAPPGCLFHMNFNINIQSSQCFDVFRCF